MAGGLMRRPRGGAPCRGAFRGGAGRLVPGLRARRIDDAGDMAAAGQDIPDLTPEQAAGLVRAVPGHNMVVDGAHHVSVVLYVGKGEPLAGHLHLAFGQLIAQIQAAQVERVAPVLRQIYDQMSDPKWVISMGVCASSGGMFNNYAIVQGVDHIVPVDIYLPGCPPRPEMLLDSILKLHDKIMNTKLGKNRDRQITELEEARLAVTPLQMPSPPGSEL